jgi:Xaa-Pro aminopeptidase
MSRVDELQDTLRAQQLDGWLFFDFRHSNAVALRVLGLSPHAFFSRRWMYYVPSSGMPTKLVSSVESHVLSSLPGETLIYRSWQEYRQMLARMLAGAKQVAMEYVPDNAIPYVSLVDAGTVELIRGIGPAVVSSADFVQRFEAVLTPAQMESHRAAGRAQMESFNRLLPWLREQLISDTLVTELSVQQEFATLMRDTGLAVPAEEKPLVAVNGNAANPHYSPTPERHSILRKGDLLLLDFSAPLVGDDTIFADYTWMVYLGERVPDRIQALFSIIKDARDTGIELLRQRFEAGQRIEGYEVDDAVRGVITTAGYGDAFVHRTGHNIGTRVHGNGAHLDNLETHDTRPLLANTCTSMEPGIYLPNEGLGLRTEVDILLLPGGIEVTGEPRQNEVIALLA